MSGNLRNETWTVIPSVSLSGRQVSQVRAVTYVNIVVIYLDTAKLIHVYRASSCYVASLECVGWKAHGSSRMRTALFWVTTRPTLVIFLDHWRWNRYVVPKRREGITSIRCVKAHKSASFITFAAETWNRAKFTYFVFIAPSFSASLNYSNI